MIIFPAIDLRRGQVVRLRRGDPAAQTVFGEDPAEVARRWATQGAEWLHVVNLDGAFGAAEGASLNLHRLAEIRAASALPIQFGGGIRAADDITRAFDLGVTRVVLGTAAVRQPELVETAVLRFGAERIVAGIDAQDGRVAVAGWQETSELSALELAQRMAALGFVRAVYTDIARDGMLSGANVAATAALARAGGLKVIASGGVASLEDIRSLVEHQDDGIEGAIIGQALYSGAVELAAAIHLARGTGRRGARGLEKQMLAKRIIPCLDVKDGRVVKGVKFLELRDAGDPVAQAQVYDREGADELVFLDITASYERRDIVIDMVRRVADSVFIPFTVGGGIRTVEDIRGLLLAGADKISINTPAVRTPELITTGATRFGSQCIVVAIDGRRQAARAQGAQTQGDRGDRNDRWEVFVDGGRVAVGLDVVEWAREVERRGAGEILLTSMDTDGTRAGYDIPMLRAVAQAVNIPVIASGGAGALEHFEAALTTGCADAALAASLFHYRDLSVGDVKRYLAGHGVPVRLTEISAGN